MLLFFMSRHPVQPVRMLSIWLVPDSYPPTLIMKSIGCFCFPQCHTLLSNWQHSSLFIAFISYCFLPHIHVFCLCIVHLRMSWNSPQNKCKFSGSQINSIFWILRLFAKCKCNEMANAIDRLVVWRHWLCGPCNRQCNYYTECNAQGKLYYESALWRR